MQIYSKESRDVTCCIMTDIKGVLVRNKQLQVPMSLSSHLKSMK